MQSTQPVTLDVNQLLRELGDDMSSDNIEVIGGTLQPDTSFYFSVASASTNIDDAFMLFIYGQRKGYKDIRVFYQDEIRLKDLPTLDLLNVPDTSAEDSLFIPWEVNEAIFLGTCMALGKLQISLGEQVTSTFTCGELKITEELNSSRTFYLYNFVQLSS